MKNEPLRPIRLEEYRPPAFLIDSIHLDVSLHPTRTRVRSRLEGRPNPASAGDDRRLELDGERLELGAVRLERTALAAGSYEQTPSALIIPQTPDRRFRLELETYINPEENKALQGLYRSRGVYCTQCEAEGFRRITYFLD